MRWKKNCTSRELLHLVDETGHSRIPVYDDEIDRVVGVVNAKQLFRFLEQSSTPEDLDRIVLSQFIEPTYFACGRRWPRGRCWRRCGGDGYTWR